MRAERLGQNVSRIGKVLRRRKWFDRTAILLAGDFNIIGEKVANGGLLETGEYGRMEALLGYPRDLFREQRPTDPGFNWDGGKNDMIPEVDEDRQRLDYVLAFDRLPVPDDGASGPPPNRLECKSCEVARFWPDEGVALSDHYVVRATVAI